MHAGKVIVRILERCRAPEVRIAGVYTYGCPKWCNQAAADLAARRHPGRIFRYVHGADLVCWSLVGHAKSSCTRCAQ